MLGMDFDDSTVAAIAVPMMHTAGLNALLLPTLISGGSVALLPTFDAAGLLDLLEIRHCTFTFALPAGMQFVAAEQERPPRDLSSVRIWLSGGDTLPVSLQQRWKRLCQCPLVEGYGMSESIVIASNPSSANRPGSFGVPAAKVELRAIGFDGTPVADGALLDHPLVMEAGVVGAPDDVYGERVAAFVALGEGRTISETDLREFTRQRAGRLQGSRTHFISSPPAQRADWQSAAPCLEGPGAERMSRQQQI